MVSNHVRSLPHSKDVSRVETLPPRSFPSNTIKLKSLDLNSSTKLAPACQNIVCDFSKKPICHLIFIDEATGKRVFLSHNDGIPSISGFEAFMASEGGLDDGYYFSSTDVARFVLLLENQMRACSSSTHQLLCCADNGIRGLSRCVFLLGAFLILARSKTAEQTLDAFSWLGDKVLEGDSSGHRNETSAPPPTHMPLRAADFWRALVRARDAGWIMLPSSETQRGRLDLWTRDPLPCAIAGLVALVPHRCAMLLAPASTSAIETDGDASAGTLRGLPESAVLVRVFAHAAACADDDGGGEEAESAPLHVRFQGENSQPAPRDVLRLLRRADAGRLLVILAAHDASAPIPSAAAAALAALCVWRGGGRFSPREALAWALLARPPPAAGSAPRSAGPKMALAAAAAGDAAASAALRLLEGCLAAAAAFAAAADHPITRCASLPPLRRQGCLRRTQVSPPGTPASASCGGDGARHVHFGAVAAASAGWLAPLPVPLPLRRCAGLSGAGAAWAGWSSTASAAW